MALNFAGLCCCKPLPVPGIAGCLVSGVIAVCAVPDALPPCLWLSTVAGNAREDVGTGVCDGGFEPICSFFWTGQKGKEGRFSTTRLSCSCSDCLGKASKPGK